MKVDFAYDNSEMERIIDEAIHNEMHRTVLKLRLMDHHTYQKIAEEVDRCPRQISNILDKEIPKVAARFKKEYFK